MGEYHFSRLCAGGLFDVLYFCIVYGNVFRGAAFAVERRYGGSGFYVFTGRIPAFKEQYDVGTGYVLCMEPYVR